MLLGEPFPELDVKGFFVGCLLEVSRSTQQSKQKAIYPHLIYLVQSSCPWLKEWIPRVMSSCRAASLFFCYAKRSRWTLSVRRNQHQRLSRLKLASVLMTVFAAQSYFADQGYQRCSHSAFLTSKNQQGRSRLIICSWLDSSHFSRDLEFVLFSSVKNGISQLASQAPALINLENLSTYIGQPPGAWPAVQS